MGMIRIEAPVDYELMNLMNLLVIMQIISKLVELKLQTDLMSLKWISFGSTESVSCPVLIPSYFSPFYIDLDSE